MVGFGRNRFGEDILSELVSYETFKDVFVELIRVDLFKDLVDYQF